MAETSKTKLLPPSVDEVPGMSNFDHSIDDGLGQYLRDGGKEARHAGWDFNGMLYYKDGLFYEDVYRFHELRETIFAPDLRALMNAVNDEYGWD